MTDSFLSSTGLCISFISSLFIYLSDIFSALSSDCLILRSIRIIIIIIYYYYYYYYKPLYIERGTGRPTKQNLWKIRLDTVAVMTSQSAFNSETLTLSLLFIRSASLCTLIHLENITFFSPCAVRRPVIPSGAGITLSASHFP